jgi:uridine kinase
MRLHLYLFCWFLLYYFPYRTIEVPSSRIVIIEGIYALSEKLRPLLDLRVSVTGGVHFDLVKRVLRDIQRAGQEPEEIIHQISETVSL